MEQKLEQVDIWFVEVLSAKEVTSLHAILSKISHDSVEVELSLRMILSMLPP